MTNRFSAKSIISHKNKKLLKYRQSKESGFTLIELLIVLTILAILMTIAFVFLGDQGKRARLTTASMSVKSAMTIAAACYTSGGTISNPPSGINSGRGPSSDPVCVGSPTLSAEAVWPQLPEKCRYCGDITADSKIEFECQNSSSCGAGSSYCKIDTTQCIQNN